jgi:regulator of protease activity HflC (stomatin/prohibitin superfamily)
MLAVVAVAAVMLATWARYVDPRTHRVIPRLAILALAKWFAIGIGAAFLLTFLTDAIVIVPAGHRGVVFDAIKGVRPVPLKEGLNFITPFVQDATMLQTRLQVFETDGTAASKDLQIVHAKVAVNLYLVADEVAALFQETGIAYADKLVAPAVQEVLKASTARYTAEELITKRESVRNDIHKGLVAALRKGHMQLVETYITDFDFSREFSRAIEEKQVAEQQALRATRELQRVKIEAEQEVTKARAEAEGLKMQREAASGALVELRQIEAQKLVIERWDGTLPKFLLGNAQPFVDLSKFIPGAR